MAEQLRKTTVWLSKANDQYVGEIIAAGLAHDQGEAIRFAINFTAMRVLKPLARKGAPA